MHKLRTTSSTTKNLRDFGYVVGGICVVLGAYAFVKGRDATWLFVPGVALALCALIVPRSLSPFYRAWMALGFLLGWVMTRLILSVAFFAIVTPLALVLHLTGKDFLDIRSPRKASYWVKRDPETKKGLERYERQF